MIWKSWPWKRDLARRAASLLGRAKQMRWQETSMQRVEQDVFLVAYSIRKLVDSGKISDEIESISVQVKAYPKHLKSVDMLNWHNLDEVYELDAATEATLSLRELCNQIIHSFVFLLSFAEDGALDGFFVASDRAKEQRLYFLALADLVSACTRVAEDHIVRLEASRSGVGAPLRVSRKSNRQVATSGEA